MFELKPTAIHTAIQLAIASPFLITNPVYAVQTITDGAIGNDILDNGGGADNYLMYGYAGNDDLSGGNNYDQLYGGGGNDTLDGGAGADRLYGDAGADILNGDADDTVFNGGGPTNDSVVDILNVSVTTQLTLPVYGIEKIVFTGFTAGVEDIVKIDFGGRKYESLGVDSGNLTIDLTGFGAEDKLWIQSSDGGVDKAASDKNVATKIISQTSTNSNNSCYYVFRDKVSKLLGGGVEISTFLRSSCNSTFSDTNIHIISIIGTSNLVPATNLAFF